MNVLLQRCYYLPMKKGVAFPFVQGSNPLYPRMLFAKFGWIWPSGSIEEDFWSMYFRYILITLYLLLEKGEALHLNNLIYPSPKDGLCQVWLKLAQWFWRWRFFKFVNVFTLFRNHIPLEKGGVLEFPSFKDDLC